MIEGIKTKHIALQYSDRKKAEIFFNKILGLKLSKTFTLSKELSNDIFNINEEVAVDVYINKNAYFEVFITDKRTNYNYEHTCIEINDKDEFIKRCKNYDIDPIFVKKGKESFYLLEIFQVICLK